MALIRCPECGRKVSSKAPMCPGCGVPIAGPKEPQPQIETAKEVGTGLLGANIILFVISVAVNFAGARAMYPLPEYSFYSSYGSQVASIAGFLAGRCIFVPLTILAVCQLKKSWRTERARNWILIISFSLTILGGIPRLVELVGA